MIKSTMADWAIHVARMRMKKSIQYFGCNI